MTRSKGEIPLFVRPRSFPTAEECGGEFNVSADTWLKMVRTGAAPPPIPGSAEAGRPRWSWADVATWVTYPAERAAILARYRGERLADNASPGNLADYFADAAAGFRRGKKDGKCDSAA